MSIKFDFNVEILNDEVQDILWLKLSNNEEILCICVRYLPPQASAYNDSLVFLCKAIRTGLHVSTYW